MSRLKPNGNSLNIILIILSKEFEVLAKVSISIVARESEIFQTFKRRAPFKINISL